MEDMFISVLNMSLTASYVIAAIMLARLFLKKAPKIVSYALWAVAGFRLVFSFSFESVFSLIPFKSAPIPADIATQPIPHVDSAVSQVLPAATPAASVNPLQIWLTVGSYLWLAGIAVMLIYSMVSIILLKRRLNSAMLIAGNIHEANNLKTPFVLGLFRPRIYIPKGLSEEEKRYIILHERTHIRRHDHVVKFLAYFILCLHWFNPLAWVAFFLMGADMEMSCDERVLKEMDGDIKKAYSTSLLSLATGRRLINGSPLAFGEGNVKGRIKNVLNYRKPAFWIIAVTIIAVAVVSIGLLTNPKSDVLTQKSAEEQYSSPIVSIGTGGGAQGVTPVDDNTFNQEKAISMVIKDHPDFPANPSEILTKKLSTGGEQGSTANVKFTTKVEKTEEATYTVTLTKDWGLTVNGKHAESFWKYKVTSDSVKLLESVDNDYLPDLMK